MVVSSPKTRIWFSGLVVSSLHLTLGARAAVSQPSQAVSVVAHFGEFLSHVSLPESNLTNGQPLESVRISSRIIVSHWSQTKMMRA